MWFKPGGIQAGGEVLQFNKTIEPESLRFLDNAHGAFTEFLQYFLMRYGLADRVHCAAVFFLDQTKSRTGPERRFIFDFYTKLPLRKGGISPLRRMWKGIEF